jgi:hypothetical protein
MKIIKTAKELKAFLANIPDDFTISGETFSSLGDDEILISADETRKTLIVGVGADEEIKEED